MINSNITMNLLSFMQRFPNEASCIAYLKEQRKQSGFVYSIAIIRNTAMFLLTGTKKPFSTKGLCRQLDHKRYQRPLWEMTCKLLEMS